MNELTFREADLGDVSFLVEAIMAAERVHDEVGGTIYERVFGLTGEEVRSFILENLVAGGSGHQLSLSSFSVLAEPSGPVAGCCAWVEGGEGQPNGLAISMALSRYMGMKKWRSRAELIRALASSAPQRTPMALQLESFFVDPAARGRGAAGQLIEGVLDRLRREGRFPKTAEISLLEQNVPARRAYEKAGFEIAWRTPHIGTPYDGEGGGFTFIQMIRILD